MFVECLILAVMGTGVWGQSGDTGKAPWSGGGGREGRGEGDTDNTSGDNLTLRTAMKLMAPTLWLSALLQWALMTLMIRVCN